MTVNYYHSIHLVIAADSVILGCQDYHLLTYCYDLLRTVSRTQIRKLLFYSVGEK